VADLLADWIASPLGIGAILGWTILTGIVMFWFSTRLSVDPGNSQGDIVRRVFRNSMIPIVSQILVRVVDLIVAIALLRLLGPTGNGQYAVAVVVWLYVKTISDFGLSLLATREVARDRSTLNAIVGETTLFRWLVLLVTAIPVGIYVSASLTSDAMALESALAIGLLYLSIVPASYSEASNAALNGLERMEIAALINVGVSMMRAPLAIGLGASALGVPGVALAAVLTSLFSAVAFHRALRSLVTLRPRWRIDRPRFMFYARESWPLLINSLLMSLFFRVDVFIIAAIRGDAALGIYDAAYKLINVITIVPAYAVLAVFPLMAQRAKDPLALARAQRVTTYSLVIVAWVFVFSITALSDIAIQVLAGDAYLPEAAVLLRVLIWFAPISFVNGVFQYVLVAAGEQRRLVPAFLSAVAFNLIGNLALVPIYGARASALLTVATEFVILGVLLMVARKSTLDINVPRTLSRIWRPTVSGVVATLAALALRDQPFLALALSSAVFLLLGLATGVIGAEEKELFRRLRTRADLSPG
jgi:O-antigen/teichoic acid export membrane protein